MAAADPIDLIKSGRIRTRDFHYSLSLLNAAPRRDLRPPSLAIYALFFHAKNNLEVIEALERHELLLLNNPR